MRIDLHTHTKKCKAGDPGTRNIDAEQFYKTVSQTDVQIIAITNHNHFDLNQFDEFVAAFDKEGIPMHLWPGAELDIKDGTSRGHLLVVCDPSLSSEFGTRVSALVNGRHPDVFEATIAEVVAAFDDLGPVYVAHYLEKKPSLSDEAISELENLVGSNWCVVKEASNAISAGIYISHGHRSIYGSDVQDWSEYVSKHVTLPELRLPVDSFSQFKLLLRRDVSVINTILNKKTSEKITITPVDGADPLTIPIYDDINVLFGPKGTGKTCILSRLSEHYSSSGNKTSVFRSGEEKLSNVCDLSGKNIIFDLEEHGIEDYSDNIGFICSVEEQHFTALSRYSSYLSASRTNANSKRILIKDLSKEPIGNRQSDYDGLRSSLARFNEYVSFVETDKNIHSILDEKEREEFLLQATRISEKLIAAKKEAFIRWQSLRLYIFSVDLFAEEVSRKTSTPIKPKTPGFQDWATNRLNIYHAASELLEQLDVQIDAKKEYVGFLGAVKGKLHLVTEYLFQNGRQTDVTFWKVLGSVKKNTQKKVARGLGAIKRDAWETVLFGHLARIRDLVVEHSIEDLKQFLLFKRYFALNDEPYDPSSGESSMIMLQRELAERKEIYLLDEPEKSLGNEYINEVIVPLIKMRAYEGAKLVIATHDANIAVRTMPYCSIYRTHDSGGYSTYVGNPFLNELQLASDQEITLNWKEISMKTLEGGPEAFGERGMIYGSH